MRWTERSRTQATHKRAFRERRAPPPPAADAGVRGSEADRGDGPRFRVGLPAPAADGGEVRPGGLPAVAAVQDRARPGGPPFLSRIVGAKEVAQPFYGLHVKGLARIN